MFEVVFVVSTTIGSTYPSVSFIKVSYSSIVEAFTIFSTNGNGTLYRDLRTHKKLLKNEERILSPNLRSSSLGFTVFLKQSTAE